MLTDELQEISALARDFARAELRPNVERWDHDAAADAAVVAQIAELGFFGMLVPESAGGMGMEIPAYVAALEQLAWGEPGVALLVANATFVTHVIANHANAQQQQSWLAAHAAGEAIGAVAFTDADDAPAARIDGTALHAHKAWVTGADRAGLFLVRASSGEQPRIVLVPRDAAGVSLGARAATMGLRTVAVHDVRFDGVEAGADALLPAPALDGDGVASMDVARLGIAAISVGIAQAALDHAAGYADQREQFRTKLREFEAIQFKLANIATRTEAARTLLYRAAAEPTRRLSAMAKVFASETAMWAATEAVQIYGGYGYMRDYPVEKLMRDAKAMELLEEANDVHRVRIAESLYEE